MFLIESACSWHILIFMQVKVLIEGEDERSAFYEALKSYKE